MIEKGFNIFDSFYTMTNHGDCVGNSYHCAALQVSIRSIGNESMSPWKRRTPLERGYFSSYWNHPQIFQQKNWSGLKKPKKKRIQTIAHYILPSKKLIYPLPFGTFEAADFPFPNMRYVSFPRKKPLKPPFAPRLQADLSSYVWKINRFDGYLEATCPLFWGVEDLQSMQLARHIYHIDMSGILWRCTMKPWSHTIYLIITLHDSPITTSRMESEISHITKTSHVWYCGCIYMSSPNSPST